MYHQYRMDDPVQFPIVEKCIELDMPILMHAGKLNFEPESQPRISQGEMCIRDRLPHSRSHTGCTKPCVTMLIRAI